MGNSVSTADRLRDAEKALIDWGIEWSHKTHLLEKSAPNNVKVTIRNVKIGSEPTTDSKTDNDQKARHIHTLTYESTTTKPQITPLVLIHGYAQSASQFYASAPVLSTRYEGPVHAIDHVGCGLSTREKWHGGYGAESDLKKAEAVFVDALEQWRESLGIEKMILAAHSMGAYTSVRYCEKYPTRVEKLILLSPAGVPEKPADSPAPSSLPWYFRLGRYLWNKGYGPFDIARTVGRRASDQYTQRRYPDRSWVPKPLLADQLYYNWIHDEVAIGGYSHAILLTPGAYAREPLCRILPKVMDTIGHVSFVYGEKDWMTISAAEDLVRQQRVAAAEGKAKTTGRFEVYQLQHAGHSFLVENPLAMVDAIMMSLDTSSAPKVGTFACGGRYPLLDIEHATAAAAAAAAAAPATRNKAGSAGQGASA